MCTADLAKLKPFVAFGRVAGRELGAAKIGYRESSGRSNGAVSSTARPLRRPDLGQAALNPRKSAITVGRRAPLTLACDCF